MSKPILSELEYNADDVASAILSNADLSVTNEDLGVVDVSDQFTIQGDFSEWHTLYAFKFNGFVFLNASLYQDDVSATSGNLYLMTAAVTPENEYHCGTASHHGDTAEYIKIDNDGYIKYNNMWDQGSSYWHVLLNCWYRLD